MQQLFYYLKKIVTDSCDKAGNVRSPLKCIISYCWSSAYSRKTYLAFTAGYGRSEQVHGKNVLAILL